jgi:Tfp pilus assembly protein FimV
VVRTVALGALLGALMTSGVLGSQRGGGTWITVRPGQTLWAIASAHYPQTDPRQSIYDIQAANHLGTVTIYPGERLLLPTE